MPKSLNDAIGCWTTDTGGLLWRGSLVMEAVRKCRYATQLKSNNPERLKVELDLLKARTEALLDLTKDAQKRLQYIVETKELDR